MSTIRIENQDWFKTLKMFMETEIDQSQAVIDDVVGVIRNNNCTNIRQAWLVLLQSRPWIAMDILDALVYTPLIEYKLPEEFNKEYDEIVAVDDNITDQALRELLLKRVSSIPKLPTIRAMTTDVPDEGFEEESVANIEMLASSEEEVIEDKEKEERPHVGEDG